MRWPALPVGDNSARGLNHGDGRLDVIGIKASLDHQVNLPSCQQRVGVTVHAIAGEFGLGRDTFKASAFRFGAHFRKGCKDHRFRQRGGFAGLEGHPAVRTMGFGNAKAALETLTNVRLIDHTVDRTVFIGERNQNAPSGCAGDKPARTVNGVKHPSQAAASLRFAKLFTKDAVLRAAFCQNRAHRLFGGAICHGHRIEPLRQFVVCGQSVAAKVRKNGRAGCVCHGIGHSDQVILFWCHWAQSPLWRSHHG
mmetsp:Transcript_19074/g.31320  ORF Transcript_19074/g.31320 Transcript_19074/m.31320 type:complete len:252 (+) Transcript_19074:409-1164(+)